MEVNVHAACQPRTHRGREHAGKSEHKDAGQFWGVGTVDRNPTSTVTRNPAHAVASTLRQPSILDERNQSAAPVNHAGMKPKT
jgi:hypothetical protein